MAVWIKDKRGTGGGTPPDLTALTNRVSTLERDVLKKNDPNQTSTGLKVSKVPNTNQDVTRLEDIIYSTVRVNPTNVAENTNLDIVIQDPFNTHVKVYSLIVTFKYGGSISYSCEWCLSPLNSTTLYFPHQTFWLNESSSQTLSLYGKYNIATKTLTLKSNKGINDIRVLVRKLW